MRRFVCLCALCLLCGAGYSQFSVYRPMPDSNVTWCEMQTYGTTCGIEERYLLTFGGDTIINSISYHKMVATGYRHCLASYVYFTNEYRGAFREDTAQRRVYWVDPSYPGESVLYDFNLNAGDTTPISMAGPGMIIFSIDSVLVGPSYHKQYSGVLLSTSDTARIIEGVGSNRGFYTLNRQGVEFSSLLNELQVDSSFTFVPSGWNIPCGVFAGMTDSVPLTPVLTIGPNPSGGEFTIEYSHDKSLAALMEIYDATGRVIVSEQFNDATTIRWSSSKADFSDGLYFVRFISGEDGVVTRKIIVHK